MHIPNVVVYSEPDRLSLPVLLADEAVCIGPGPARHSYLGVARILAAADITGCTAVHPGYGFLSENADFAEAVVQSGREFIGPRPETIRLLGDKLAARTRMREAGVPVVPGTEEPVADLKLAAQVCVRVGLPVIVKAAAGGGGKGMRIVRAESELEPALQQCQTEAQRTFDDGRVYIEKYISRSRHIEVQLLADRHGNVAHLGERDCSTQRRHQKLIEESPAPGIRPEQREQLGAWAVAAARSTGYEGAGTVEFICDEEGNCYFMEMNARLQVEHPVTEMVTGTDIVREQLRIVAGQQLELGPDVGRPRGHAIECRVYAEDPEADFAPCPGTVTDVQFPAGPGVRVDSHLMPRSVISPFYDAMVAKVIVWAQDRPMAIVRMERALAELRIGGVKTTVGFLRALLRNPGFAKGRMTTSLLDGD
jgi:acetyl-CoA carboxylase biotin carboxylase subunit